MTVAGTLFNKLLRVCGKRVVDSASNRKEFVDNGTLFPVPNIGQEMYLFPVTRRLTGDEAEDAYASFGLEAAGWEELALANDANPAMASERPNATQWRDRGRWCYITFSEPGENYLLRAGKVDRWDPGWWLAGRPIKWDEYR
ncbi:MAG: hypothetical protein Q7R69_00780 [bacterium]|nr:hypothetical protein [bacterium]